MWFYMDIPAQIRWEKRLIFSILTLHPKRVLVIPILSKARLRGIRFRFSVRGTQKMSVNLTCWIICCYTIYTSLFTICTFLNMKFFGGRMNNRDLIFFSILFEILITVSEKIVSSQIDLL